MGGRNQASILKERGGEYRRGLFVSPETGDQHASQKLGEKMDGRRITKQRLGRLQEKKPLSMRTQQEEAARERRSCELKAPKV